MDSESLVLFFFFKKETVSRFLSTSVEILVHCKPISTIPIEDTTLEFICNDQLYRLTSTQLRGNPASPLSIFRSAASSRKPRSVPRIPWKEKGTPRA